MHPWRLRSWMDGDTFLWLRAHAGMHTGTHTHTHRHARLFVSMLSSGWVSPMHFYGVPFHRLARPLWPLIWLGSTPALFRKRLFVGVRLSGEIRVAGFLSSWAMYMYPIFLRSQTTHACTKSYYLCGPPLYTLTQSFNPDKVQWYSCAVWRYDKQKQKVTPSVWSSLFRLFGIINF